MDTVNFLQWRSEGARYGEVVQFSKRVRIYSGRRKRCFCPYFGCRERAGLSSLNEGQVIEYGEQAKNIGRKSEGSTLILLRAIAKC